MFPAAPDPPENLKWRDKSAKAIFLSWEPPKYDGGAPIKGYVVDKCQRGTDKWEPCGDPIPEPKYRKFIICNVSTKANFVHGLYFGLV